MAEDAKKFEGLAKHFNSHTSYGRANVSDLTLKLFTTFHENPDESLYLPANGFFECSIYFPGDEGNVRRFGTDRLVLLHEKEEQKDVTCGRECSRIM